MSYSQHKGEEEAILQLFHDGKDAQQAGKALDIGAWSPTTFSNTRALYERGWELVLVEPSPGPFLLLMRACRHCGRSMEQGFGQRAAAVNPCGCINSPKDRRETYGEDLRVKLVLAAVGPQPAELLPFHATDDALSTASEKVYISWKNNGGYYGNFHAPSVTVEKLWQKFGPFDFVNIDAEGMNRDVLLSMPLDRLRPQAICVEYSPQEVREMADFLIRYGYIKAFRSTGNLLYKRLT
jgi:hypothetical protein